MEAFSDWVKDLWNKWELRSLVLLSLSLQIILILVANIRKTNSLPVVNGILWLAYLLADLVATFSLGILSKAQSIDEVRNACKKNDADMQLRAFWAPFLLLHLGGPGTITAFSLEDNELWLRHGLGLLVQVTMAISILARYYPEGVLLMPSVLVFIAGLLKYGERTWALKRASMDGLRTSTLDKPDPGPDYANTMNLYSAKLRSGVPAPINVNQEAQAGCPDSLLRPSPRSPQNGPYMTEPGHETPAMLMLTAHKFFHNFKGLFVDSMFSFRDRERSQSFFRRATFEQAFKVIEIELSFAYDVLYTKAAVSWTSRGLIIRAICFSATLAAAFFFYNIDKKHILEESNKHFQPDVMVSYTLLIGAILIDIFSWTIVKMDCSHGSIRKCIQRMLLKLRPVKTSRWSNSISQYSLLSFCLKVRRQPWRLVDGVIRSIGFKENWDLYCYTTSSSLGDDIKEFIFQRLKHESQEAQRGGDYKLFNDCRGDWALKQEGRLEDLGWSTRESEFEESLLMWHLATDLCYSSYCCNSSRTGDAPQYLQVAQELSNYLVYLLVVRPLMLPSTAVVGVTRCGDTCAEVIKFLREAPKKLSKLEACSLLLSVNTDLRPKDVKGDKSKSVLWDGCRLAKELVRLEVEEEEEERWKIIAKVWVEMLCYVAIHCKAFYHAQQLSAGGELLTFAWFLFSHLGMGEQYKIETGDAQAEVVGDDVA